jgi:hypothetical protein
MVLRCTQAVVQRGMSLSVKQHLHAAVLIDLVLLCPFNSLTIV